MWINRTSSWLLVWAILLLMSGEALAQGMNGYAYGNAPHAQPRPEAGRHGKDVPASSPFHPVDFEMPVTPFAPADISDFGNGPKPNTGFFFSYERVFWSISKPEVAQIGDPNAVGLYLEAGPDMTITPPNANPGPTLVPETNSLDTGFLRAGANYGNRYDFGYMESDDHGWLCSIIEHVHQVQTMSGESITVLFDNPRGWLDADFQDLNRDGYDDDLDGDFIFGRDGEDSNVPHDGIPDTASAVDLGDVSEYAPKFDIVNIKNETRLNGVEVMRMYRAPRSHKGGTFEMLCGVRFIQLQDKFSFSGLGGVLGETFSNTKINNNIVGPQVGGRWSNQRGRWLCSVEGRGFAAVNAQYGIQQNLVASIAGYAADIPPGTVTPPGAPPPTGLLFTAPNSINHLRAFGSKDTTYATEFTPGAELRVQTCYQITKAVALKVGYTALWMDGIGRASNRINWSVPAMGIKESNTSQDLFINGVNFGIEINR